MFKCVTNMTMEKLDEALSNVAWRKMFPDAHVKVLARVEFLDNHPMLVMSVMRMSNNKPRPSKFESV